MPKWKPGELTIRKRAEKLPNEKMENKKTCGKTVIENCAGKVKKWKTGGKPSKHL